MNKKSDRIEGLGMLLLLISFGWQTFQQHISDLGKENQDYQVHEKLDILWEVLADQYSHSTINRTEAVSNVKFEVAQKKWKYWDSLKRERARVESQEKIAFIIQVLLYVFGTILVIYPKFKNIDVNEKD